MKFFAIALATTIGTTFAADGDPSPDIWAKIGEKRVQGTTHKGNEAFLGLPFADPPTGEHRLRAPRPYTGNIDGYTAIKFGSDCIGMDLASAMFGNTGIPKPVLDNINKLGLFSSGDKPSEDCLNLNVFRPRGVSDGARLPVWVSIFGGGFESGSPKMMDPSLIMSTARKMKMPVIYVSINYRIGGFGFLAGKELTAEGSTNLGLLDQRLGLQWVQDNIAGFGGDPTNVVINGESAGSISCMWQMIMNNGDHRSAHSGEPLFHGAIMQSGSILPSDKSDSHNAQKVFDKVAATGGCGTANNKLACLRKLSTKDFEKAHNSVPSIFSYNSLALSYMPRPDGKLFSDYSYSMMDQNKFAKVPFIIGDMEDEGSMFSTTQRNVTKDEQAKEYMRYLLPKSDTGVLDKLMQMYPSDKGSPFGLRAPGLTPESPRLAAILGDVTFQWPRRKVLENVQMKPKAPQVPAWSYQGTMMHGVPIMGTMHGSDMMFVGMFGDEVYAAKAFRRYFLSFIYSKDPNKNSGMPVWGQYGKKRDQLDIQLLKVAMSSDTYRIDASNYINKNIAKFLL